MRFLTECAFDFCVDKSTPPAYNIGTKYFQGGVQFPTGSKVCEPLFVQRPNR